MAADRAFLEHHAAQLAVVFQKLSGADVARDQDRVVGHRVRADALTRQDAQQAVRQIVQIVQARAQVGVGDLLHAGACGGLFLFDSGLGAQTAADVLLHPAHPAARIGEHAKGFQHVDLFAVAARDSFQHPVHAHTQLFDRVVQALKLAVRVVGDGIGDHHARLVQPDMAFGAAFLPHGAGKDDRLLVARRQGRAFADKSAQLGHLGQHHGNHFQRINRIGGKFARLFGLHHQNAQLFAQPLDRHTKEGRINLFAGFGHVPEPAGRRGVGGVHDLAGAGHAANQAFAQPHPRLVHGFGVQTFGCTKLERVFIAEQVDRAHFGAHAVGGQVGDAVKPFLPGGLFGHQVAQPPQQLPAFAFESVGHSVRLGHLPHL